MSSTSPILAAAPRAIAPTAAPKKQLVTWLDPLAFRAGDPSLKTSFNAVNSGVGSGLSGLQVKSSTIGDEAWSLKCDGSWGNGGNKVIEMGAAVPPGYVVLGVKVQYESSSAKSAISQIRLSQVNEDNPTSAMVVMDETPPKYTGGPTTVTSIGSFGKIDPSKGQLMLSLRTNFGDTKDTIVIRSVGLILEKI